MNLLPEYSLSTLDTVHCLDALTFLRGLPSNYVNCIVTSPPYWGLRNYGIAGQIGLEADMQTFIQRMVALFREARRVLRDDGVLWLNLGDTYYNSTAMNKQSINNGYAEGQRTENYAKHRKLTGELKPKDLCGIPWRTALALQADGWWLRSDIIWHKPNPMPESVTDRPTKAHEYIFLLTKSATYWYDADAIREEAINAGRVVTLGEKSLSRGQANGRGIEASGNGKADSVVVAAGRNKRTVWTVATQPYSEAHFATYPLALIDPCVKAGCPPQVCVECGAPWVRATESKKIKISDSLRYSGVSMRNDAEDGRYQTIKQTIGWQPTCTCSASTRPGIVYDPFMGAGTTALAAIQNNRHYIGSELNPAYVQMARQRIAEFDPFQDVQVTEDTVQLSLFAGVD